MRHLDEGTIVALRDDFLVIGDARLHADGCSACRQELVEARARAEVVGRTLALLDDPGNPDVVASVDGAKAAVRRRLDSARTDRSRTGRLWHVGKAAAALVVTAGAVAALPNSPVRQWLSRPAAQDGVESTVLGTALRAEGGIEVTVPEGRISVSIDGMADGSDLEVVWVETSTARIVAGAGSRFSYSDGRAQASVVRGPVRIDLPRLANRASVEVDGRPYLRRTTEGLTVLVPVLEQSSDRIRFRIQPR